MLWYLEGTRSTSHQIIIQLKCAWHSWHKIRFMRKCAACKMCWFKSRRYTSWYTSTKYWMFQLSLRIVKSNNLHVYKPGNCMNGFKMSNGMNGFKMSQSQLPQNVTLFSTVCAQLYHAGTDAQLDVNGKRQPVFPAAHGQLHHALICEANIHRDALHERGNSHQVSMDYQRNAEDQDTVRHLRQCQHQRHWQGTHKVHWCGAVILFYLKTLCFVLVWLK